MAAEQARRADPQLAAKYKRLTNADRHHDSAVCHIATSPLTRIAACLRLGEPYQIRDLDGTPLTKTDGKRVVAEHHQVPKKRTASTSGDQPQGRPGASEVAKRSNIPACQHQPKPPQAA